MVLLSHPRTHVDHGSFVMLLAPPLLAAEASVSGDEQQVRDCRSRSAFSETMRMMSASQATPRGPYDASTEWPTPQGLPASPCHRYVYGQGAALMVIDGQHTRSAARENNFLAGKDQGMRRARRTLALICSRVVLQSQRRALAQERTHSLPMHI